MIKYCYWDIIKLYYYYNNFERGASMLCILFTPIHMWNNYALPHTTCDGMADSLAWRGTHLMGVNLTQTTYLWSVYNLHHTTLYCMCSLLPVMSRWTSLLMPSVVNSMKNCAESTSANKHILLNSLILPLMFYLRSSQRGQSANITLQTVLFQHCL